MLFQVKSASSSQSRKHRKKPGRKERAHLRDQGVEFDTGDETTADTNLVLSEYPEYWSNFLIYAKLSMTGIMF